MYHFFLGVIEFYSINIGLQLQGRSSSIQGGPWFTHIAVINSTRLYVANWYATLLFSRLIFVGINSLSSIRNLISATSKCPYAERCRLSPVKDAKAYEELDWTIIGPSLCCNANAISCINAWIPASSVSLQLKRSVRRTDHTTIVLKDHTAAAEPSTREKAPSTDRATCVLPREEAMAAPAQPLWW